MKDVKRFNSYTDGTTVHFEADPEGAWVAADDYDAALSKLAAETLRADTAEATSADLKERLDESERRRSEFLSAVEIEFNQLKQTLSNALSCRDAAEQRVSELEKVLDRIARPHDCGCWPCMGSCVSQEALQITVDEMRERAGAALNPTPKEESHE